MVVCVQLMYKNKTTNNKQFVCVFAAESTDFTTSTTTCVSVHTKHPLGVGFVVYGNS